MHQVLEAKVEIFVGVINRARQCRPRLDDRLAGPLKRDCPFNDSAALNSQVSGKHFNIAPNGSRDYNLIAGQVNVFLDNRRRGKFHMAARHFESAQSMSGKANIAPEG